jgi:hypothetical protein
MTEEAGVLKKVLAHGQARLIKAIHGKKIVTRERSDQACFIALFFFALQRLFSKANQVARRFRKAIRVIRSVRISRIRICRGISRRRWSFRPIIRTIAWVGN